jgi:hypothetical protein
MSSRSVNPLSHRRRVCFARKVCRFARKVCRLASKSQKMAHGTATGSALQALAKGPHHTIPTPSCGRSSPKIVTLPERCAEIVRKSCREEQGTEVFHAQICQKSASVFTAKLSGKICDPRQSFSGNAPTPCPTTSQAENSCKTLHDNHLEGDNLSSDLRQTFVTSTANLADKAQRVQ